jgi:hypothetical protein
LQRSLTKAEARAQERHSRAEKLVSISVHLSRRLVPPQPCAKAEALCEGGFVVNSLEISGASKSMNTHRDHPRRFADSPIRRLMLLLFAQTCLVAMAQGQSPTMIGSWNIEIAFGDGSQRTLRFDAQEAGKGTLLVVDPRLKVWGPGKPSEAKWSRGEGNSVTFSGAVEFMLGNVGRDAGTLMFKGKFETPDSISGEVEFAPLVGDRPTRHGTFKATRAQ